MTSTARKEYYELQLPLEGFDTDVLSGWLHQNGCLGIYEASPEDWIVYLPGDWPPARLENLLQGLTLLNPAAQKSALRLDKLPYQDWNSEWRKHFEPFPAADGVWVRPPWRESAGAEGAIELVIDPQMAFGTGHHETTRLMIQVMQQIRLAGEQVLDLGTGSGILAILARKQGASSVLGIDNDPDAIDNARHNALLNQVDQIDFQVGDIGLIGGDTFPVILANIHFEVLKDLALQFYHALPAGGRLVVSGLLKPDVNRLSYVYKHAGLLMLDRLDLKEWSAIIWEKR
ncbi:MAG: 50S ribosomal protein L11 methyltransferase [Calditrichaeota bacterium]|nr:50S ribosomal protein L11 methyltransferase [Calditrichota bacterium]